MRDDQLKAQGLCVRKRPAAANAPMSSKVPKTFDGAEATREQDADFDQHVHEEEDEDNDDDDDDVEASQAANGMPTSIVVARVVPSWFRRADVFDDDELDDDAIGHVSGAGLLGRREIVIDAST